MREQGEQGEQGGAGEEITNAQYPMPHAQCPISKFTQIFLKNLGIWYASLVFLKKS